MQADLTWACSDFRYILILTTCFLIFLTCSVPVTVQACFDLFGLLT
jgi:hypothetical protein